MSPYLSDTYGFMNKTLLSTVVLSFLALSGCNDSDDKITSDQQNQIKEPTLVSFAKLDVATYADGPDSGLYVKGANGIYPPFKGQPVQGFSGALKNADGTYLVMSDNGFGAQDNSADYLLRLYNISVDFRAAKTNSNNVKVLSHIQLRDPNKLVPFKIVNESTAERLLTGADFDPESIQRDKNGDIWIGDEFGPFLLHFSADGVLKSAPIALPHPEKEGEELRSPQNQLHQSAAEIENALVQRSGGFEGMAISPDGQYLYPMLEKPLSKNSQRHLLISKFDIAKKAYTNDHYYFELDPKATAIGDFQLFSQNEGIVIERDDTENNIGGFKKLVRIQLNEPKQLVNKTDLVNLMDIANPNLLYGTPREGDIMTGERFGFPFFTIEDIVIEGPDLITVLNDNNFPGSSGRNAKLADDNEIIQIKLDKKLY